MHTARDFERFCDEWLAAWTGNRPDQLLAFYTNDVFYRDPARPAGLRGIAALGAYLEKLLAKNPEWIWRRTELHPVEKGFFLKWNATVPGKGRTVTVDGLDLIELSAGKIARNEIYFDPTPLFLPV